MKTAELTGADLALWVAKAESVDAVLSDDGKSCLTFYGRGHDGRMSGRNYSPHEHWSDGGPLLDKYQIGFGLYMPPYGRYFAVTGLNDKFGSGYGDTHLIAACRAIVFSAYGDTVPDEPA